MNKEKVPIEDVDKLSGGFLKRRAKDDTTLCAHVDPRTLSTPEAVPLEKGAGKGRKTKLAAFGLSPSIIKEGDPDYAKCLDQANKYRKTRMKELAQLHGHVSAGAGALLASASLALASSRYLYQKAASDGDSSLLKQASQLADSARSAELAAWEMSAKEGVLKRRNLASEQGMPWLLTGAGEEKAKTGRKTNAERQARANLEPLPGSPDWEEGEQEDGRRDA